MNITFISDTHSKHHLLDEHLTGGEMLIHCGDFMNTGRYDEELNDFTQWFSALPYQHKILIAGNHERIVEYDKDLQTHLKNHSQFTYLQDSSITINNLKFYGTPWQPAFCNWAFNLYTDDELDKVWNKIPTDTQILITHIPPHGRLDFCNGKHLGCHRLAKKLPTLTQLKIHAFGHIHDGYGKETDQHTTYINAAQLDEQYQFTNQPITISIE